MNSWMVDFADLNIELLLQEPFLGRLLLEMPRREDPEVEDLALAYSTECGWNLLVNPEWLSMEGHSGGTGALWLLRHELLHLVMGHPMLLTAFPDSPAFHIAADLAVEPFLPPSGESWAAIFAQAGLSYLLPEAEDLSAQQLFEHLSGFPEDLEGLARQHDPAILRHRFWRVSSPIAVEMATESRANLVRQAADALDQAIVAALPGAIQELIRPKPLHKPAANWQRLLRHWLSRGERTAIRHTMRRPSRRYGTLPGTTLRPRQRLLIAVDTSASVSEDELGSFFSEISHLARTGADCIIVECDMAIQRSYRYAGRPPDAVQGRGGTSFDAPIQLANERYHPAALLYFTDGQGPAPLIQPNCPMIWVLTGKERPMALPGPVVWLKT